MILECLNLLLCNHCLKDQYRLSPPQFLGLPYLQNGKVARSAEL